MPGSTGTTTDDADLATDASQTVLYAIFGAFVLGFLCRDFIEGRNPASSFVLMQLGGHRLTWFPP
jgi:hypothetical protein